MSVSAAVSSGAAVVDVANFLKEYMTAMEQLPRSAQLLASQMRDLDKNSHFTLVELEELTQPANFSNGSVPADLRRRLKRSLIDLQTGADEQHRVLGDVGDGIQRFVHRLQAQRKQAEIQLRCLQTKAKQEVLEPSTSREPPSSKRKRVRESGPVGTPAKHTKRQQKDTSPGPSASANPNVRRPAGPPQRKSSSVSTKKPPVSTPTAPAPVSTPVSVKKKKKRKSFNGPGEKPAEQPPEKAAGPPVAPAGAKASRKTEAAIAGASHDEPRYCLCSGVSSGPMVACDGPGCPVEWFHFECVGLTEAPKGNWYCSKCEHNAAARPRRAKGKSAQGTAR